MIPVRNDDVKTYIPEFHIKCTYSRIVAFKTGSTAVSYNRDLIFPGDVEIVHFALVAGRLGRVVYLDSELIVSSSPPPVFTPSTGSR